MHHANDVMVIQTSQLGQIKNLEDEICVFKEKVAVQDAIISNLVSNNLDHLQFNMNLTQYINKLEVCWSNNEIRLQSIKGLLHKLRIAYCGKTDLDLDALGPLMLGSGGDDDEGSDGGEDRGEAGASIWESSRPSTPAPREERLIKQMEESAEMGFGGWFNREDQSGLPESWCGPNSDTSASQDWVRMTVLTSIGR